MYGCVLRRRLAEEYQSVKKKRVDERTTLSVYAIFVGAIFRGKGGPPALEEPARYRLSMLILMLPVPVFFFYFCMCRENKEQALMLSAWIKNRGEPDRPVCDTYKYNNKHC